MNATPKTPRKRIRARLEDCRSVASPRREIALWADRLEESAEGTLVRRIAFEDVEEVRLSVEPSGIGSSEPAQIICRVSGKDRTIGFSSQLSKGILKWENRADQFALFLRDIHEALNKRTDVRYIEGAPLSARLKAFLPSLLIGLAGAGLALWALLAGQIITALIGLVLAVAGGYSAWVFRPVADKPYDPKKFG